MITDFLGVAIEGASEASVAVETRTRRANGYVIGAALVVATKKNAWQEAAIFIPLIALRPVLKAHG
jgi:hypothetical protein